MTPAVSDNPPLHIEHWGLTPYREAYKRQNRMVDEHLAGRGRDTLALVEHPPTVTLGRRAGVADLHLSEETYARHGVELVRINRGGLATAHEPGQLVAYPILALPKHDLRWYAQTFLTAVVALLEDFGLEGTLREQDPGVWIQGRKVCSFGIAVKKWVACHGIALNLNNSLETFSMIVPCGHPDEIVTSVAREIGRSVALDEVRERFVAYFSEAFGFQPIIQ